MKILKIILAALALIAIIVAFIAPIGPLPGFFIGGSETSAPAVWQDTSDIDEIRLKVVDTIPRVVVIWVIAAEGELYIFGNNDSGWVTKLSGGGPVEARIEDNTYKLNAVKVTSGLEDLWPAYIDKYQADYPDIIASFPTLEQAKLGASVFRLER